MKKNKVAKFINSTNQRSISSKLQNSTVHDDLIWKGRVVGKLVFKIQKPLGISGAPCITSPEQGDMGGTIAQTGEKRNANFNRIRVAGADWIHLAQERI
jgi:hypothetical protein